METKHGGDEGWSLGLGRVDFCGLEPMGCVRFPTQTLEREGINWRTRVCCLLEWGWRKGTPGTQTAASSKFGNSDVGSSCCS